MSTRQDHVPSYSSFPAIPGIDTRAESGPSRPSPPLFSSFPNVDDVRDTIETKGSRDNQQIRRPKRRRHERGASPQHTTEASPRRSREADPRVAGRDRVPTQTPTTLSDLDLGLFIDTTGDKDNITYGRIACETKARYRRAERGRLLGFSERYRAVKTEGKTESGLEVAEAGLPYISRYSSIAKSRFSDTHLRFRSLHTTPDVAAMFLAFEPAVIEGISHPPISRDEEPEFDLEEELMDDVRVRIRGFERHLALEPMDVDTWLTYAHHHHDGRPTSAGLEVTRAILDRALKTVTGVASIPLYIDLLHTVESLWAPAQVERQWRQALDLMTQWSRTDATASGESVLRLWQEYLSWAETLTTGSARTVDDVVAAYEDIMARLQSLVYHLHTTREQHLCYIIKRLCLFLRRTGFDERAIAILQAQCEFTFFRPESLPVSDSKGRAAALEALEDFWDSGYPRCGEDAAKGWKFARPAEAQLDIQHGADRESVGNSDDPYIRWYMKEKDINVKQFRPARADDVEVEEEDDPFRFVVFDDIRPFIFTIDSEGGRTALVFAVLQVLGVPLGEPGHASASALSQKSVEQTTRGFVVPDSGASEPMPTWQVIGGQVMEPVRRSPLLSLAHQPVRQWATTLDTLFTDVWFQDVDKSAVESLDQNLIRNICSLVRTGARQPAVDMCYLAFEAACSVKGALRVNKRLLAEDRANADLWVAYARLERRRGKLDSARTIYSTAIGDASTNSKSDGRLRLWCEWATMEWECGEHDRCRDVLLAFSDDRSDNKSIHSRNAQGDTPAVRVLRARRSFHIDTYPVSHEMLSLACLFMYRDGVEDVRRLCQQQIDACGIATVERELAHQLLGRMIHFHNKWHPAPASLARTALKTASKEYSANTQFHTLLLDNELRAGLRTRVYDHIMERVGPDSSATEVMWGVWAMAAISSEIYDPSSAGHSHMRSIFDKALASRAGNRTATLWALAIEFDAHSGLMGKAKALFYRALSATGDKGLYLLPFEPMLRPAFSDMELQQIIDRLIGRGIRLRVPTRTFWQFRAPSSEAAVVLPQDEEPVEDELNFLQERQLLRPY